MSDAASVAVGVPIAVGAECEAVGGAASGGGLGAAVVAGEGADVLAGQRVGGVHVAIAQQAEPSGVGGAVEQRRRLYTVVARQTPLRSLRLPHFLLRSEITEPKTRP